MAKLTNTFKERYPDNIPGWPGYHITCEGILYSTKRNKLLRKYTHLHHQTKREIVGLCRRGKKKNAKIHRLVAEAYLPNPENKPCVCHKDNNPRNNHVSNLYWGTYKENSEQMVRDGRSTKGRTDINHRPKHPYHPSIPGIKGLKNKQFKLTQEQVDYLKINHKSLNYKAKLELAQAWKISRRSLDRYITKLKEGYYE